MIVERTQHGIFYYTILVLSTTNS